MFYIYFISFSYLVHFFFFNSVMRLPSCPARDAVPFFIDQLVSIAEPARRHWHLLLHWEEARRRSSLNLRRPNAEASHRTDLDCWRQLRGQAGSQRVQDNHRMTPRAVQWDRTARTTHTHTHTRTQRSFYVEISAQNASDISWWMSAACKKGLSRMRNSVFAYLSSN